jgi:hypothetical protein
VWYIADCKLDVLSTNCGIKESAYKTLIGLYVLPVSLVRLEQGFIGIYIGVQLSIPNMSNIFFDVAALMKIYSILALNQF